MPKPDLISANPLDLSLEREREERLEDESLEEEPTPATEATSTEEWPDEIPPWLEEGATIEIAPEETKPSDGLPFPTMDELMPARRLKARPPDPKFILENVLRMAIVGMVIASGGIGKSFFLMTLAYVMSWGRNLGIFKPVKALKVLYLGAEDSSDELDLRIWNIGCGSFSENLMIYSVAGKLGPLMEFDLAGNPVRSKYYTWLHDLIKKISDLDVLILDPKSRFYGLDENNNDHATQWVASLEALAADFKLTILFSHHVSKARKDTLDQSMSRGASALVDGVRFVLAMTEMSQEKANYYDVDPREYIELDLVKSNYSAKLPHSVYFKRGAFGTLEPANLSEQRIEIIAKRMVELLAESEANGTQFSRRELAKNKSAQQIRETLDKEIMKFTVASDLPHAIDHALKAHWLQEVPIQMGTNRQIKKVLHVL
jgi:hypothetical protein